MDVEIKSARPTTTGGMRLGVKVFATEGPFERYVDIPPDEWKAITSAAELTAWLKAYFPAAPAWASGMIGQRITL